MDPKTREAMRRERLTQLGEYIRYHRKLSSMSLRQVARVAQVSDPYLSQIERGLHEPSIRILTSIAEALNLKADTLLTIAAGLSEDGAPESTTESAILSDPLLSPTQRDTLLHVYRGFIGSE